MKKQKWLAALAAGCMAAAALQVTVGAAETEPAVDSWDGTADTSWYDPYDVKESYDITTAEQLAGLAELVCSTNPDTGAHEHFAGVTFTLQADLDLAGHQWKSIGYQKHSSLLEDGFQGTFDGNGHTISNLFYQGTTDECGLFDALHEGSVVKNLGLLDVDITRDRGTFQIGVLANSARAATIENCYATGTLVVREEYAVAGGLVGQMYYNDSVMTGCYSSVNVIGEFEDPALAADNAALGGLIGMMEVWADTASITNCYYDGTITSNADNSIGGIFGAVFCDETTVLTIRNCLSIADGTFSGTQAAQIGTLYESDASPATDCYWNDSDVPGFLVFDASYAPVEDTSGMGKAVSDWTDPAAFDSLSLGTEVDGVTWVMGLEHPTFDWDVWNIPADYTALEEALAKQPADLSLYTSGTVEALNRLTGQVDRSLSKAEQDTVDTLAEDIATAIAALEYRDADYSAVDAAIQKAEALSPAEYQDFSAVEAAIDAVVRGKKITEQAEVDAMAQTIEDAIAALEKKQAVEETENPATGERIPLAPAATLLLSGAGMCALLLRRKHGAR